MPDVLRGLDRQVRAAVRHFWSTRQRQTRKQQTGGRQDQGARGAVTGGAQMDGFVDILAGLAVKAGMDPACVHRKKALELPGFFRPTKEWDLVVVKDGLLLCALKLACHCGPADMRSYDAVVQESVSSSQDLYRAFRDGALGKLITPWLAYVLLVEDHPTLHQPAGLRRSPHFNILPEFENTTNLQRFELFCRRLYTERLYDRVALLLTDRASEDVTEPSPEFSIASLAWAFFVRMRVFSGDLSRDSVLAVAQRR